MAANTPEKTKLVKEFVKKYPTHPNLTLARLIYKKHPSSFKSIDNVRSTIRVIKGQHGAKLRKSLKDKALYSEAGKLNPFDLPQSHANDYVPYLINQSRTLIISDLHFPYQDNKAIELALNYGLKKNVNCILINGDLLDMPNHSRFEKDWRMRSTFEEFEAVRQFLKSLRKAFPKAKIVFKEGNHDDRWERWLYVKAPEIFDDPEFKLDIRLRLGELKIDHVKDKRIIKIGKLSVLHGHEMFGGSGGVNPARSTFLKTMASVIVGHYHKTSSHVETAMNGEVISVHSVGCLCGLSPLYAPINKHNLGFAYVEMDIKTGDYHIENLKVIKGKVY